MERAGPGDAPRQDLAALRDEALQHLDVLPIDVLDLLRAELADLPPAHEELLARPALAVLGGRAAPSRTARPGTHPHDSALLSAGAASAAGCAGAAGAGGRGGRRSALALRRSAILPARFSSSSTRTARCLRT